MFHFYLRNPVLENRTNTERADLLHPMHYAFLWNEVAGIDSPPDPTNTAALRSAIGASWEIRALRAYDDPLLTSDNPVKLFGLGPDLLFALLPISPKLLLAAVRRGSAAIRTGALNSADIGVLNSLQVRTCIREVYAGHDLRADLPEIWEMIGSPGAHLGWISSDRCSVPYHQYTADELEFIAVRR